MQDKGFTQRENHPSKGWGWFCSLYKETVGFLHLETAGGRRQGKAFGGNGRKGARWDGTASAGGEVEKNKSFRSSSQDEVR